METREELTIRLTFSRKSALPLLALFFLCWHPAFIASESLTLTTYYPAPYGGYVNLLTTQNTLLARDGGRVGVGVASPSTKLDVAQNQALKIGQAYLSSGGDYTHLANNEWYNGSSWQASGAPGALLQLTGQNMYFYRHNGSGGHTFSMVVNSAGNVGIATSSPDSPLHVAGNAHISGNLQVDGNVTVGGSIIGVCSRINYSVGGTVNCPANHRVVGFMGDGVARVSGFLPRTQTSSSVGTYVVLGEDWGGAMMCCRFN